MIREIVEQEITEANNKKAMIIIEALETQPFEEFYTSFANQELSLKEATELVSKIFKGVV